MSGLNGPFVSNEDLGDITFTYCDHCCREPMRPDSAYCSVECEREALELCVDCGGIRREGRDTRCPSCEAERRNLAAWRQ